MGAPFRVCYRARDFGDFMQKLTWCIRNLTFALTNGGTGGLFWGFTVAIFACVFIYLSMAEMASMSAPPFLISLSR